MSDINWGSIMAPKAVVVHRPSHKAPVGEICSHDADGWSHIYKQQQYAEDDEGKTIYFRSMHLVRTNKDEPPHWEYCGRPEAWRWLHYAAPCEECGQTYSNPWVPVCGDCWDEPGIYPSWAYVIACEMNNDARNYVDLSRFDHAGRLTS